MVTGFDKITGQMVMAEDGTILSSSGDLSSNELVAQHIMSLISSTFPIAFKVPNTASGTSGKQAATSTSTNAVNGSSTVPGGVVDVSGGGNTSMTRIVRPFPWKSITADFGSHSYVVCLSNRKVHVVKREKTYAEQQSVPT